MENYFFRGKGKKMSTEIKKLEDQRSTRNRFYNKTTEIIDMETGEISQKMRSFIQKKDTQDEFIKLFIENLFFLNESLSNPALRVLIAMLKRIDYQNVFEYTQNFVEYFIQNNILKKTSVYKGLKELENKGVIIKIVDEELKKELEISGKNYYLINPNIVGKGSFRNLQKLRQTITRTFDFETLQFTQQYEAETFYDGYKDIQNNPQKYQIEEVIEEKRDKIDKVDVIFSEKENKIDKSSDEIIQLENENLQLKLREKELENEKLKLELEILKLKNER